MDLVCEFGKIPIVLWIKKTLHVFYWDKPVYCVIQIYSRGILEPFQSVESEEVVSLLLL